MIYVASKVILIDSYIESIESICETKLSITNLYNKNCVHQNKKITWRDGLAEWSQPENRYSV
jgi:hypothetical protein